MKSQEQLEYCYRAWKAQNDYVNQIDMNYGKLLASFSGLLSLMLAIITFATNSGGHDEWIRMLFCIPPIAILVLFGYLGYQFQITAILRGYLFVLEKKMNALLQEEDGIQDHIFLWNSDLTDQYMKKKNVPNNFLMVPIILFTLVNFAICFVHTAPAGWINGKLVFKQIGAYAGLDWVFAVYWLMIIVIGIVVLLPFLNNNQKMAESEKHIKYTLLWIDNDKA